MKDKIQLSDHFTYGRLIRFTLPSIGMMIFTSIYGVVDGFFVSNYAGKTAFAAVNFIFPVLMILPAQTSREKISLAFLWFPSPRVLSMRAPPPVPSMNPAQPRIISTGKMKFTAAKAVLPA